MPRPKRPLPRDYVQSWPGEATGIAEVDVARGLAINLKSAMNGRSGRETGRTTGVDFSTINAILAGTTWPDVHTIARLEAQLGTDLWPATVSRSAQRSTLDG